jgi:hypothetical protein
MTGDGVITFPDFSFPIGYEKFAPMLYFFLEGVLDGELVQMPFLLNNDNDLTIDRAFNQGQILTIKNQLFLYQSAI